MAAGRLRLVRADVRSHPAGGACILTPAGRAYHVEMGPDALARALGSIDGRSDVEDICAGMPDPTAFAALLAALVRDRSLASGPEAPYEADFARVHLPASTQEISGREVLLTGDRDLVELVLAARLELRFRSTAVVEAGALAEELDRRDAARVLVVGLRDRYDEAFLRHLDGRCADGAVRWTQFHFERERGWLGPHVIGGTAPGYDDVIGRRRAAAADLRALEALSNSSGSRYLPPRPELAWMLSFLFTDLERWLAGASAQGAWHELEMDPVGLTVRRHPVLPLPGRDPVRQAVAPTELKRPEALVDERLGLIHRITVTRHHESIPRRLTTVIAHVSDLSRDLPWLNDRVAGGSAFGDVDGARRAAIGEAVERYCGNVVQPRLLRQATYRELVASGEHAVDPDRLVLFSDRQLRAPGFPFCALTPDLRIHWLPGTCVTCERAAWLPASLVYVNWYHPDLHADPPTNPPFYPGIAAGDSLDAAITAGVQEVLERHATMVWWANRQVLPAVHFTSAVRTAWGSDPAKGELTARLIHIDNEFDVPVFAGVVEHAGERLLSIGFAARPDPEQAALKALTEGLTLQELMRDLAKPDGAYRHAARRGDINGAVLKPWREDRRYLDDYRPDFRDVVDLLCQPQVHLDRRAREVVAPQVDVVAAREMDSLSRLNGDGLAAYLARLGAGGHEVFFADITTPDVELTGLRVVRVLVPGLVPNFAAGFPYLGGGALAGAAVRLGWRTTALREDQLNLFPLAHA